MPPCTSIRSNCPGVDSCFYGNLRDLRFGTSHGVGHLIDAASCSPVFKSGDGVHSRVGLIFDWLWLTIDQIVFCPFYCFFWRNPCVETAYNVQVSPYSPWIAPNSAKNDYHFYPRYGFVSASSYRFVSASSNCILVSLVRTSKRQAFLCRTRQRLPSIANLTSVH
jgi:hypothetical protein